MYSRQWVNLIKSIDRLCIKSRWQKHEKGGHFKVILCHLLFFKLCDLKQMHADAISKLLVKHRGLHILSRMVHTLTKFCLFFKILIEDYWPIMKISKPVPLRKRHGFINTYCHTTVYSKNGYSDPKKWLRILSPSGKVLNSTTKTI